MSQQYRSENGRYGNEKLDNRKKKALQVMSEAKKSKRCGDLRCAEEGTILEGYRIVNLKTLARTTKCIKCSDLLDLGKSTTEVRKGLSSVFTVFCDKCQKQNFIRTSPTQKLKTKTYSDVNTTAVLGTIHSGTGHTALEKIFTCMDIPTPSLKLYKKYEEIVGKAIEETAKESCVKAAEEEKELIKNNVQKVAQIVPQDVLKDIYPANDSIRSSGEKLDIPNLKENHTSNHVLDSNLPLLHISQVNADASSSFDCKVDAPNDSRPKDITNIIASYDMGWSKRGAGRNYDSLNGYGTLIGYMSGKVLDYATRNRKCASCDLGHDPKDHNCRKNYEGSAKSMEADAGISLLCKSEILTSLGLKVKVLVGDDDSSTTALLRKENDEKIHKLSDKNHLVKNFGKDLYKLAESHKQLKKQGYISHIKLCFTYAVDQNRGKSKELANVIRVLSDHLYDCHENCQSWCKRRDDPKYPQAVVLSDVNLRTHLEKLLGKYADNADKFSVSASSQANESINNIIAHKAPKNICYSRTAASDYRVGSAVCVKNDGESSVLYQRQKLNISPSKFTINFVSNKDKIRKKRATKALCKEKKLRRLQLKKARENLRKVKEKSEGVTYKSNCGINMDRVKRSKLPSHIKDGKSEQEKSVQSMNSELTSNDHCVVYFDLETSGLAMTDDILQIAAKIDDRTFCSYITPTQQISEEASKITGLTSVGNKLYLNSQLVSTISIKNALIAFQQFLSNANKPILLVAHNSAFDAPRLTKAIVKNNLRDEFKFIIGFTDSIPILRKALPERKGPGQFKLTKLAEDLLGSQDINKFHDAVFDVEILHQLINYIDKKHELFEKRKTYQHYIETTSDITLSNLNKLSELKGIVSRDIIKKMSRADITFDVLVESFKTKGEVEVLAQLTEKCDSGKSKVTRHKNTLKKIIDCIKKYI